MAKSPLKKPEPRPPLERIADSLALLVKLGCMNKGISVPDLRAAKLMDAAPDTAPVILNQSATELEMLAKLLPGSPEEHDYLVQAMAGGTEKARMDALKGTGGAHE